MKKVIKNVAISIAVIAALLTPWLVTEVIYVVTGI